jgi:signal transduction histidine kinase
MQPDSQFVDNYVAALQEVQSGVRQDDWVNWRLAIDFMRNARAMMRTGFLVIAIIFALLFGHVDIYLLGSWAVLCVGVMMYRMYTLRSFEAQVLRSEREAFLPDVNGFFRRHGWSWPASGVMFAVPVFLYHGYAPPINEYLYLMMMVGMGTIAASLMSAQSKCQSQFSHALCATALLAVMLGKLVEWPVFLTLTDLVFVILLILFWVLIVYVGKHLHILQRQSYSAQFDNEQLIRSLRQQTLAATDAVQMKNNLLASAAHDLRQPVHALAFYADWLRNEPQLADSLIPKILAATDSVNTLFNSLFDFARIEAGALKIQLGDVDIEQLVDEMTLQFAPAADQKGLSLQSESVSVTVRSDPVLLRRIVSNLLANAIRYTERGGVKVAARVINRRLRIEISDSGAGIAPEHLPHVFKEFYRAPVHEGTADSFGLGLAIVQRLCRSLGHTVTLHSVLGQGTVCRIDIELPIEAGSAARLQ